MLRFSIFYIKTLSVLAVFVICMSIMPAQAKPLSERAQELGFVPHKALYDIKLAGTHSGSQVLNVSGQMFYEWQPSCDAWVSSHRFNLLYEYADSPPMRITSDFSTYEPYDGSTLSFTSQRKRDGQLFEEMRGQASIGQGGIGEAAFTIPSDLSYELPEGTLFPISHSIAVAEKIREGKRFYTATIFDGSDEEGPVEVNSFIGKQIPLNVSVENNAAIDKSLLDAPARMIRLAFFPLKNSEETSDYEMTLTFHENSVISDMLIEYDDFSVSQRLVALEPVTDACHNQSYND